MWICDNWRVEYWHKVWELYAGLRQGFKFASWAHRVLQKAHYSAQTGTLFWNIFRIASTPFHYLWFIYPSNPFWLHQPWEESRKWHLERSYEINLVRTMQTHAFTWNAKAAPAAKADSLHPAHYGSKLLEFAKKYLTWCDFINHNKFGLHMTMQSHVLQGMLRLH